MIYDAQSFGRALRQMKPLFSLGNRIREECKTSGLKVNGSEFGNEKDRFQSSEWRVQANWDISSQDRIIQTTLLIITPFIMLITPEALSKILNYSARVILFVNPFVTVKYAFTSPLIF